MVSASTRAMTSYGPVTTSAEIPPAIFASSTRTEAALPVSAWISTYACTTWHRLHGAAASCPPSSIPLPPTTMDPRRDGPAPNVSRVHPEGQELPLTAAEEGED